MTVFLILKWWGISVLLGAAFLPVTSHLFRTFDDRGWLFSKVTGMMLGGYAVWALSVCLHMPFTRSTAILVTAFFAVLIWIVKLAFMITGVKHTQFCAVNIRLIIAEEVLFLAALTLWVYMIGFHPEVTGTEKPMDYGFMAALDRSTQMPAKDIWYGTDPINYYYGGQYFSVYYAKIAFTEIRYAYNMMRALIAALVFVMPFSLVRQLLIKVSPDRKSTGRRVLAVSGGLLGAAAVSCAGNLHYVLYGLFGKVFRLNGWQDYWFPESTRFIGHNPPTDDACIHEFPSYSFVLGDMHAHMINLIFVMLFLGILAAWMLEHDTPAGMKKDAGPVFTDADGVFTGPGKHCKLFSLHLLCMAAMTGMFKWTNYWDYIIYLTVLLLGMGILLIRKVRRGASLKREAVRFLISLLLIWLVGKAAAYPFTSTFDMMVSGVAIAKNHTAFYQFAILWGLPVVTFVLYTVRLLCDRRAAAEAEFQGAGHTNTAMPYFIALLFGVCALGLILIPEIVYVKDIYEEGFSRSNTMFKLTYQAFVMFGLLFGFALPELLVSRTGRGFKKYLFRIAAGVLTVLLLLTIGYFPYSVKCWFGNVLEPSGFQGMDAIAFLEDHYPEDAAAIRWLDNHTEGQPVVLETWGDSYSEDCRVSAFTGIPTVQGWYVHEWLWREDVDAINARIDDVNAIFMTAADTEALEASRGLLKKYGVEYIFVGSCERKKYPALDETALKALGTVVYEDETYVDKHTLIIKVE